MRRLVIIVEGDTEKEFVDKTLAPFLYQRGLHAISSYKITKTNGGLTHYNHLKKDLVKAVNEANVLVTTLVDYYALPDSFPNFKEAQKVSDKKKRMDMLEQAILEDIQANGYVPNLIPYIQLHEFEAFAFTCTDGFKSYFNTSEADFRGLQQIIDAFPNPEEINDGKTTAPSKRLRSLIPGYDKVVDGNAIISANGIDILIKKCPRFAHWIDKLIAQK